MSYNTELQENNAELEAILDAVNELPESTPDGYSPSAKVEQTSEGAKITITDKDGTTTATVTNGKDGKDGYNPIVGVDYWTTEDQEKIVQQVITALGTPVFGRVDAENNIILTGELADGTYTIKYEDAEGNVTEIGTIEVGGIPDESGPIAIELVYGVKLDKNSGAEGSGTGYAASQSIPYDPTYTYTMSTTDNKNAYGAACWYDASGNYLGWNDVIAGVSGTGAAASGVLTAMDGAASFRLRIVVLSESFTSMISLRKDLIQQEG